MHPLAGFSDSALVSRDEVSQAAMALLHRLQKHQSPGGARIRVSVSTGAHFDEAAAQLEGFARPLWAVAALLLGQSDSDESLNKLVAPFVQGLAHGTDPKHPEYWGPVLGTDQRMVEMEIISFALLAAPGVFYGTQTLEAKVDIVNWLRAINDHPLPVTNWLWFRVMTNLALIQCCGIPRQDLWPSIEKDLKVLDSFYLEDGWSSDGPWTDQGRQADYYSGSFAIQFSQLLYIKFAANLDPERCSKYRQGARAFAQDFMHYFDKNGAAIPFGRSLTYRFAFAGFWSAAAFAEVELADPLSHPGVVKGLLLRHMRWWSSKREIFNVDGTLNIGFTYPNMYMCEDYNSPQSVYWCMKSFIALALPITHHFWQEQETPLPPEAVPLTKIVTAPKHILCNSGSHHFLLSAGQFCPWPLKATEAKYGKFAYSSHFGFSVPTGPLIQQIAPDSTLALSIDNCESWRTRWIPFDLRWGRASFRDEQVTKELPVLVSSWRPWSIFDVTVSTALIPPSSRWPEWHTRIHKIRWGSGHGSLPRTISKIVAIEGGFAIDGRKGADGRPVPTLKTTPSAADSTTNGNHMLEAALEDPTSCCVFSKAGASGIRWLNVNNVPNSTKSTSARGSLLKPDSNTNLMCPRTVIPTIRSEICLTGQGSESCDEQILAVAVFATTATTTNMVTRWPDVPTVRLGHSATPEGAYIEFLEW